MIYFQSLRAKMNYAPYEADAPHNHVTAPPHPKYLQNCCSKGYRAFAPYTSNWPYNAVFPPNDRRMDEWQSCLDPQCYQRSNFVCWNDKYNQACVNTAPDSSTFGYWEQLQRQRGQDSASPPQFRRQPDEVPRGPPFARQPLYAPRREFFTPS